MIRRNKKPTTPPPTHHEPTGQVAGADPASAEITCEIPVVEEPCWSDELTGAASRRRLDRDLQTSADTLFALMMIEVVHRRRFAELVPAQDSSEVLRRVAEVVHGEIRSDDELYRFSENEFCLLLPATQGGHAEMVGQRVRHALVSMKRSLGDELSVAIGVATVAAPDVLVSAAAASLVPL
jgi:diguanylate cyclase (GGDEF)-like protein